MDPVQEHTGTLTRPGLAPLAWKKIAGRNREGRNSEGRNSEGMPDQPTRLWLGGFASDMMGTKARWLAERSAAQGRGFLRFDYTAHGASGGDWDACRIGTWKDDTLAVIDQLTEGPLVLIGSSMGGWMALLAALARPERVAALVLLAPAPDFPQRLTLPRLSPEQLRAYDTSGYHTLPMQGVPDKVLSKGFFDESAAHGVLDNPLPIVCPVRILQGDQDPAVPVSHMQALCAALTGADVVTTRIRDGDHSLSRPSDLQLLGAILDATEAGL